jgi:hypothetical protein
MGLVHPRFGGDLAYTFVLVPMRVAQAQRDGIAVLE